jgi:Alpha/beta hydrolase domain
LLREKIDRRLLLGIAVAVPLAGIGQRLWAQAANAAPPYVQPRLTAPLPDPVRMGFGIYDVSPLGYVAEERLMTGMASTYAPIHEGDFTVPAAPPGTAPDPQGGILGGPGAGPPADMPGIPTFDPMNVSPRRPLSVLPYTTRLVIYRPRDMRRFSGNVIVETIHPSGGGSTSMWATTNRFLASRGDIFVGVQHPRTLPWLKYHWPERYAPVSCTDYTQIWGMLTDTARLLKDGGSRSLFSAKVRRIYLTGYSFTGLIATSMAKQHHTVSRMPDGSPLFDGYPIGTGFGPMPPLDVPVLIGGNQTANYNDTDVQPPSTSPALQSRIVREGFDADSPMARRRRYEVVGFQHAPMPLAEPGSAIPSSNNTDNSACYYQWPAGAATNPNTLAFQVYEAMFRNMSDWVDHGIAAPRAALSETARGKPVLDEFGNPRGGLRLPDILVPLASYGTGFKECALRGWRVPFTPTRLNQIYGDWPSYLQRYNAATDKCVVERFILADRGDMMKIAAERSLPLF